ncbi:MAG: PH domain-containing protein [Clostridia bacterium]|nr:PH domain-containing protein [Clostridia bacterium]
MGYIENNLVSNEMVIAKAKFSWLAVFEWLILPVLFILLYVLLPEDTGTSKGLFLGIAGICLIPLIGRILTLANAKLVVTNKRVIGKIGIIKRTMLDIHLTKVDHVYIKETFFGRIFGYSTIMVSSTGSKDKFDFISKAPKFKNLLMEAIDTQREKDRVEQANLMAQAMKSQGYR